MRSVRDLHGGPAVPSRKMGITRMGRGLHPLYQVRTAPHTRRRGFGWFDVSLHDAPDSLSGSAWIGTMTARGALIAMPWIEQATQMIHGRSRSERGR
jgi:hypothetical protein